MVSKQSAVDVLPLPVGSGGLGVANPTIHCVLLGEGTSAVTPLANGTTGQVLAAVTGADPAWTNSPTLNIVDNTTGTVASPTTIVVNTTYVADQASVITGFLLPATATLGQTFSIIGNGPGGWQIQQNANQAMKQAGNTTTTGTNGSLSSTSRFNSITAKCIVAGANTIWNISDANGTLTFA